MAANAPRFAAPNTGLFPRKILLLLPVAVVLLLIAGSALLWSVRRDLLSAAAAYRDLTGQVDAIRAGDHVTTHLAAVQQDLIRARNHFAHAADSARLLGPIPDLLRWLPIVGPQVAAIEPLSSAGRDLSAAALSLDNAVTPLFHTGRGGNRLALALPILRHNRPDFARACIDLTRARKERGEVGRTGNRSIDSALHSFDRGLPVLQGLCRSLGILPALLGEGKARTYLVAYQDPEELRATGGFIGSISLLHADKGSLTQIFLGTNLTHENLSIPPPEPVRLYNREKAWLLRDANWSPDFPTSARLEEFFLHLDLGRSTDGVIDLTPAGVAAFLQGTGPLVIPEYHTTVDAGNIYQLADYYAHIAARRNPSLSNPYSYDVGRKAFIGIVGSHIIHTLLSGSPMQLARLASPLSDAVARRDIQLFFNAPGTEATLAALHATGTVNSTPYDYLYAVDTNLSYNKINPYVRTRDSYRATVHPDGWIHARLTLTYTNTPAPSRLAPPSPDLGPGEGPGGGTLGGWDDYADYVRVLVPAGAELIDQNGWTQPWYPGPAYAREMFSGYLIVPSGQSRTVTLDYVIPANATAGQTYHLLVQHQPGSGSHALTVEVRAGRHVRRWSAQLSSDAQFSTALAGIHPHPIPLPRTPAHPQVLPGSWIEPHAYLAPPTR